MFAGEPDLDVAGDAGNELGVNDRATAVAAAFNRGLLTPDGGR